MQPQQLLDTIQGNPEELKLFETIRFRRRTRSNPVDLNTILQALRDCTTIQVVICSRHFMAGITQAEWFRFLQTMGSIPNLKELYFVCHSVVPVMAICHAVSTSRSLRKLFFGHDNMLTGNIAELRALATRSSSSGAPRTDIDTNPENTGNNDHYLQHSVLEELIWLGGANDAHAHDASNPQQEPIVAFDALLQALIPCPKLRTAKIGTERIPEDTLRLLLRAPTFTSLHMLATMDEWLVVANELQQNTACLKELVLSSHFTKSDTNKAIGALATAIQQDEHLVRLRLEMCNGYTDDAGVALAEAMRLNTVLRHVDLDENGGCGEASGDTRNTMGCTAYKALTAMAVTRSDLKLGVPVVDKSASTADKEQYARMRIELRLNAVGRRQLLATSPTTREAWVNGLVKLNTRSTDAQGNRNIQVDCLYTFLLLNPTVCHLDDDATA
jgi:hypothetical protein